MAGKYFFLYFCNSGCNSSPHYQKNASADSSWSLFEAMRRRRSTRHYSSSTMKNLGKEKEKKETKILIIEKWSSKIPPSLRETPHIGLNWMNSIVEYQGGISPNLLEIWGDLEFFFFFFFSQGDLQQEKEKKRKEKKVRARCGEAARGAASRRSSESRSRSRRRLTLREEEEEEEEGKEGQKKKKKTCSPMTKKNFQNKKKKIKMDTYVPLSRAISTTKPFRTQSHH